MTVYNEFIEKVKIFLNNSNVLMFNDNVYTFEQTEKILYEKVENFNPSMILDDVHYKNIIQILINNYMVKDRIFYPYHSKDYSFLDNYNQNVKNVIINQIDLDTNMYYSSKIYKGIFSNIDNIDDLLTLTEIYINPPEQLESDIFNRERRYVRKYKINDENK